MDCNFIGYDRVLEKIKVSSSSKEIKYRIKDLLILDGIIKVGKELDETDIVTFTHKIDIKENTHSDLKHLEGTRQGKKVYELKPTNIRYDNTRMMPYVESNRYHDNNYSHQFRQPWQTRPYYGNIRFNNQNNYHFPRLNYDRFCDQNRWETSYIPFNNHDTRDNNNNRFNINNKGYNNNYKPFNDFKNYNRFDNTRQPFQNFRDYNRSNVHQQFYDRDNKNYNHNPRHQVPYSNKINTFDIEEIEDDKIISIDKKDYNLLNIDINNKTKY
ncbi:homeobox protein 2-like [Gordionus sp. m RMFG-2023]|uniref:homeobox protein 2-like n=1 Tax=Gordionus sp. m RMFG-2023 TaxID=3053472 RepID=UPI0031FDD57A